jgi:hypothetical protein
MLHRIIGYTIINKELKDVEGLVLELILNPTGHFPVETDKNHKITSG